MTKKDQENPNVVENVQNAMASEDIIVSQESVVRKIVRYGLVALGTIATGVVGFLLGRNTGNDDDSEEEDKSEEAEG